MNKVKRPFFQPPNKCNFIVFHFPCINIINLLIVEITALRLIGRTMGKTMKSFVKTRFGWLSIVESEDGIHEIAFEVERDEETKENVGKMAEEISRRVDALSLDECTLPIVLAGTECQKRVWEELRGIGMGETITYAELAKRVGKPRAVRAVASACGKNKLPLLIPCHRVVASNGKLGGYSCRFGVAMKKTILEAEKKATTK